MPRVLAWRRRVLPRFQTFGKSFSKHRAADDTGHCSSSLMELFASCEFVDRCNGRYGARPVLTPVRFLRSSSSKRGPWHGQSNPNHHRHPRRRVCGVRSRSLCTNAVCKLGFGLERRKSCGKRGASVHRIDRVSALLSAGLPKAAHGMNAIRLTALATRQAS